MQQVTSLTRMNREQEAITLMTEQSSTYEELQVKRMSQLKNDLPSEARGNHPNCTNVELGFQVGCYIDPNLERWFVFRGVSRRDMIWEDDREIGFSSDNKLCFKSSSPPMPENPTPMHQIPLDEDPLLGFRTLDGRVKMIFTDRAVCLMDKISRYLRTFIPTLEIISESELQESLGAKGV